MSRYDAIVMGTSAGGLHALKEIIPHLKEGFPVPVIVVQHMSPDGSNYTVSHLDEISNVSVKEAEEKEELQPGTVYMAAPNYHLLVDRDRTLSLSVDPKVNYSRPSIDVLFETAAEAFGNHLLAVILTGANSDGTLGAMKIQDFGGTIIVEDPDTAEVEVMPLSVIEHCKADKILPLEEIAEYLNLNMDKIDE